MTKLFIGLMSGTSIDGLDGVLMSITAPDNFKVLATTTVSWSDEERELLNGLCQTNSKFDSVYHLGQGSNIVAQGEAKAVFQLLKLSGLKSQDICAIGAHGQTICHHPEHSFSLQIDNGPLLANLTDIDAIVNFRAADIANGGQGAPLAQAFHQKLFVNHKSSRVILNLGGIANISVLDRQGALISAFDTGPANTLIDYICRTYFNCPFDHKGSLARTGKVDPQLLQAMLLEPYFAQSYPKSTGRELFNSDFLQRYVPEHMLHSPDLLATLTELTAQSVMDAIYLVYQQHSKQLGDSLEIVVCGGGAYNDYLLERMTALAKLKVTIGSCDDFGIDAKFIEAQAFAYFAYCTVNAICLPLNNSTHARRPSILGCICPAPNGYYARS